MQMSKVRDLPVTEWKLAFCMHWTRIPVVLSYACVLVWACMLVRPAAAEEAALVERRLTRTTQYLADDRLAGRGVGTPEIEVAAEFLHDQLKQLGLETTYQSFDYTLAAVQGTNNHASFVDNSSNEVNELQLDTDFRPLAIGGAGSLDAPLVFAGYGITAPDLGYDDYANLDVQGKTVIVLRHEPQQGQADSVFNGVDHSEHAPFRRKIRNALDHGAAGILFCTGQFEVDRHKAQWKARWRSIDQRIKVETDKFSQHANPSADDIDKHRRQMKLLEERRSQFAKLDEAEENALLPFEGAGPATSDDRLPVVFASRAAINQLLSDAGRPELEVLEQRIDEQLKPQSFELADWRMEANVDISRETIEIKNVIGVLEGAGPNAQQTLVVGAHYDHLGRGLNRQKPGEIHNGADDNASGIALLLETAGHFASQPTPPARRMVFIAFTGEERGLLGSAHYVSDPLVPLESTVAMFNFDMVGRLTGNRLILSGVDTAAKFSALLDEVNERHGFELAKVPGGLGPSDHASFCTKQVPVLHFFTGLHNEYHRPSDDIQLLNVPGMRRINDYTREVLQQVLDDPTAPTYTETDGPSRLK